MSDPKRFDHLSDGMWQNSAGDYVLYSDYARLKAEVERLREAGDELCESPYLWEDDPSVIGWRAAKEGKPTEQKSPSFIEDLGNGVEKHNLLFQYPANNNKKL